jgi:hypothetical protein
MTLGTFAMRYRRFGCGILAAVVWLGAASAARAQAADVTLRVALLPQWVVNQHRVGAPVGSQGAVSPQLGSALDAGVVDRVVFWWQRGVIQRDALVWKPIRVLEGDEAAQLGGRGGFELRPVRQPSGGAAWTQAEIVSRGAPADGVAILEIGGELAPLRQVLDSLFLVSRDGAFTELELTRRAVIAGPGIQIVTAPFGRPAPAEASALFRGSGLELLVVRSQVEVLPGGTVTPNGFGDLSTFSAGAWREGDRVLMRVPLAVARPGLPAVVMGWRDRVFRPDGGDGNEMRRSSRLTPVPR